MKVITSVVNNPHYIVLQYFTLKKFFQHEHEFIVFNDAKDFEDYTNFNNIHIKKEIEETCNQLNIKCINIPNENHKIHNDACVRASDALNFMLKYQKENPDQYFIIDSDMFFIDYFNPKEYMKYDCAVILQKRNNNTINYFWNGLCYFNMNTIKNQQMLDWTYCDQCDVGGMMYKWVNDWLKENKNRKLPLLEELRKNRKNITVDNILFINHLWSCTWDKSELPNNLINNQSLIDFLDKDIRNTNNKYFCEIYDNCILHIRAGGNWLKESKQNHMYYTHSLLNLVNNLLKN